MLTKKTKTMRNIKLTIQFDGTQYHGWQTQSRDRTVQQTVQDVLSQILNSPIKLHGSGRTDAGVHALGQVANFLTDSDMDLKRLMKSVNSLLPQDIVVRKAEEVEPDFHARFSATSRLYWYLIWNFPESSPFYCRYSWHIMQPLDVPSMREAAQCLKGVNDFSSFQGADREDVKPVREVKAVRFKKAHRHMLIFEIQANAFLKHMVRNIVGTLAEVGKGKLTADEFRRVLEKRDRGLAGATAPAHGLFLKEVRY
jgi:tRNA pseudouridine38-40 synthase